jgi:hypothetical protein
MLFIRFASSPLAWSRLPSWASQRPIFAPLRNTFVDCHMAGIQIPVIVLAEQRGTCSTKHALLRRLAIEQGLDIALVLGIYEMTERNTPGDWASFAAARP